jgi:electron transport complex protein RnfC
LSSVSFPLAPGESPCIRSGDCDRACPEGLPVLLLWDALRDGRDGDSAEVTVNAALDACRGCAACDAACTSRIPLSSRLLAARDRLRSRALLLAGAAAARQRHEARASRLQRDATERAGREAALREQASSGDAVAAAIARAAARRARAPGDGT